VRNHFEQSVLRDVDLSWTGFVVLWVVWIWGDIETRHVAEESGHLQGHAHRRRPATLANRGLLTRTHARRRPAAERAVPDRPGQGPPDDRAVPPVSTPRRSTAWKGCPQRRIAELTRVLRHMLNHFEQTSTAPAGRGARGRSQSSTLPTLAHRLTLSSRLGV